MSKMFAVIVKPNTERAVLLAFKDLGIECIAPTLIFHKRVSRHAKKTIEVEKLAIPCTFFVCDRILGFGFDRMRELVPNYRGVMRGAKAVLEFPRDQIDRFKEICDYHKNGIDESELGAGGEPILVGDRVEISFGPFSGISGVVEKITDGVADLVCDGTNFAANTKIRLSFLEKISDKADQDDR